MLQNIDLVFDNVSRRDVLENHLDFQVCLERGGGLDVYA